MTRTVTCIKLNREAEGLVAPPYPGELGVRIYENVSKEAWQMWLSHQTMLINEYRLTPVRSESAGIPGRGNGEIFLRRRLRKTEGVCAPYRVACNHSVSGNCA